MLREQLLKAVDEARAVARPERGIRRARAGAAAAKSVIVPWSRTKSIPPDRCRRRDAGGRGREPRPLHRGQRSEFPTDRNILNDRPGTKLLWAETAAKDSICANPRSPQLILLDLDLPDMHGSEGASARLRANPTTAQMPVIVISADATPSQIERMLTAGARDYLTKPFEIRRFLLMFDEIFSTDALTSKRR